MMQLVVEELRRREIKKMPKESFARDELLDKLLAGEEENLKLAEDNRALRAELIRLKRLNRELREKLERKETPLQPCPFCGSKDIAFGYDQVEEKASFYCSQCNIDVACYGILKNDAIKIWNTRAASPKVVDTDDEYPWPS